MASMPRDPALDSTLHLALEGYDFIWNRCRKFDSDLFATRILGRPAVCIHGPEAARLFYDEAKFARSGAVPRRIVTSLFGKQAVHTLDDAAHKRRKSAFLGLMTPENLERLAEETARAWRRAIRSWQMQPRVVLLDAVQCILAEAVCAWAGVPLHPDEVSQRARDLAAMVDGFGGIGPRLWKGKLARVRTELWIARVIHAVRREARSPDAATALHVMAHHRDANGRLLPLRTAAIELINVLRPTVAIAWYVAFAAHALHEHPEARERIAREHFGDDAGKYTDAFMQEVRRFYPFTPYLGARVRARFTWKGHDFVPGTLVLLDVHGTDHDPRVWTAPAEFRPERFLEWHGGAFDFIPQGGGDHARGHRCPGEWITMHNLALALHFLTRCCTYEVPPDQDLSIDLTRMPTQPASGFILRDVRATGMLDHPAPRAPSSSAAHGLPPHRFGVVNGGGARAPAPSGSAALN